MMGEEQLEGEEEVEAEGEDLKRKAEEEGEEVLVASCWIGEVEEVGEEVED